MQFTVFTDGCSNLPGSLLRQLEIRVLPCSYVLDGEPGIYEGDIDAFDAHGYYDKLRSGSEMKTSLLNTHLFMTHFQPELEQGRDVIYVGMSSGISGTIQAARIAAEELQEAFPERTVRVVDSLGAGFGPGLLACRASELRAEGKTAREAADILDDAVPHLLQYFTVDDLNFLKRTGRVSGATAAIGTVLNIKPLLWGDPTGHIVALKKCRGRKKAMDEIVELYRTRAIHPENQRIAISHGDCPEEAELLAERICEICRPRELIVCAHEPFTGAHVGPGMLALFFFGEKR
ncbi:MAG: DegV family protein [Oscillospiraceae bacterium]|nr:DegV family protein [Oscillospiraceae bacterium]MBQ7130682.1 DegV family protein [Oscillospiraceae bacterium]